MCSLSKSQIITTWFLTFFSQSYQRTFLQKRVQIYKHIFQCSKCFWKYFLQPSFSKRTTNLLILFLHTKELVNLFNFHIIIQNIPFRPLLIFFSVRQNYSNNIKFGALVDRKYVRDNSRGYFLSCRSSDKIQSSSSRRDKRPGNLKPCCYGYAIPPSLYLQ